MAFLVSLWNLCAPILLTGSPSIVPEYPVRESTEPICIVWDIGGTLVHHGAGTLFAYHIVPELCKDITSPTHVAQRVGALVYHGTKIRSYIFQALVAIGGAQDEADGVPMRDDKGHVLPLLMVQEMNGTLTMTKEEILAQYDVIAPELFADKACAQGLITSVRAIINVIFDEHAVASTSYAAAENLEILKAIKEHNPDVQLYVLSNYGDAKFTNLMNTPLGQEILACIPAECMVVSARVGDFKPRPSIFAHVCKLTGLPAQCHHLIDDQPENGNQALREHWGFVNARDPEHVRQYLRSLGLKGL